MLEGHLLNERYKIKRRIGGGGMANVYLATDTILERDVAIKVLRWEFANDPEFIERFDREAHAATSLSHPNIVNIYDVGEEDNISYMVMEYVDGLTLKEYIVENGPLDVKEAVDIMKQLTSAIGHAHANGLIHRDIKPQNVLIDKHGIVKITDFGIALALSHTSLTQTNSILGSVHYLSPEQARGGMATKKSDIYSLGIVFYELLTGELPFLGQSPVSIALKHLQNETPSVREFNKNIPQSVENIVLKATAKDPFHRYESVFEMESALQLCLDPNHMNVAKFSPPEEEGETTKAIPIITDEQIRNIANEDDTIIVNETPTSSDERSIQSKEPKLNKKRPFFKRKGFLITKLILIAIIGLSALVGFLLNSPKDVVIPDLVGVEYEEAKQELEALNLTVEKETMPSDEIVIDHVVKTDPAAGKTVKEKSTVTVYVSEGKERVEFGDYIGESFNQVKRILEEAGYKEVRVYEKISDQPEGEIITQIQPNPKEEVVPSETVVIFEISAGPERVTMGNFQHLTLEEIEQFAEANGLRLEVLEEHSEHVEKGRIIRQSPNANTQIEKGSTIHIVVSKGPEELPPKLHRVTFTVPFQPKDGATEQSVQIYVNDANNDITEVFHEDIIRESQEYTLTLAIKPNERAFYKVVRDGEVILEREVTYQEGG